MKIIVPMAGKGSRLRPHTLTVPKPLIPIAGKPIVQRLAEEIHQILKKDVEEVAFITGDFGLETEEQLLHITRELGVKGRIYRQEKPLGTAHALLCAQESLEGPIIIAFADTLFKANFSLETQADGLIWTSQVSNPQAFGVVTYDEEGYITGFIEKPDEFVSDLAIIGIYYIKEGKKLKKELQYLIDKNLKDKGEYQLTDALENMRKNGMRFSHRKVDKWMDCGSKSAIIDTNTKVLEFEHADKSSYGCNATIKNSLIIEPCFIGEGAMIENSKIGPFVSIGKHTQVKNSNIETSLIQNHTEIIHANLSNSMIGNSTHYQGVTREISLGDYSVFDF